MSAPQFRRIIFSVLLNAIALPACGSDKPLLTAGTETPLPGETRPSPQLVRIVFNAINKRDIKMLDDCVSDQGLKPADYASLLRAVRISAGAGHNLWFVRPALEPYCQALYGAHLFRYFLADEQLSASRPHYRLLFQNGGDSFDIYPQQSHGLNDIEATGCIAIECRSVRMSFDGRAYRPVRCTRTTWNDKQQEVTEQRRCGSDDWRDDQSSGFEPAPGR
jgi:hypothetical protein